MTATWPSGVGRLLRQSARGPTHSTLDGEGRHRVLGAGGLQFRCIEPFRKWAVSFEDTLYESTIEVQVRGNFRVYCDSEIDPALKRAPAKWHVELENVTPGWTQDYRPTSSRGAVKANALSPISALRLPYFANRNPAIPPFPARPKNRKSSLSEPSAFALTAPNFGMAGGVGYYEDRSAATMSFIGRVGKKSFVTAGVGLGFNSGSVGARGGFQLEW